MPDATIGLTRSDRANDYVSHIDGWRPSAVQDFITITLDDLGLDPETVADLMFEATNHPAPTGLALQVIRKLRTSDRAVRSLSVGDTVTVEGVTLACADEGWLDVTAWKWAA